MVSRPASDFLRTSAQKKKIYNHHDTGRLVPSPKNTPTLIELMILFVHYFCCQAAGLYAKTFELHAKKGILNTLMGVKSWVGTEKQEKKSN